MDSSKIDSNIKQILDLRNNKGVFPLSTESAIIAHSPGGEMTYLDSVIDYLYQQVANKLRLYTEQDGNNTRGKAYPATMGLINAANIASLQSNMDRYAVLLNTLQQQVDNMDLTDDITSMNNIINQLQQDFNNLMQASEYTYQEIKFSDSDVIPSSNLDNPSYWDERPQLDFEHLWLGVRTVTVKRGSNGEAIITKGTPTIVSLQGPRGEQGPPGPRGGDGLPGESYRPVLMYKWTDSRIVVPDTPTDPLNQGWSENPGSSVGDAKYLWMTQNYKKMSTNTYLNSWSTPVCLSGEDGNSPSQGLSGPVMRFRGEYTPNTEYINSSLDTTLSSTTIRYIDVVMLGTNYYMVKPSTDNGTRRTYVSPLQVGQTDWQEAAGFSFIAAEALYARNAHIDNLSGYEFVVQDNPINNHIVAGMTGGTVENSVVANNHTNNPVRIWAGSNAESQLNLTSNAIPFKVYQNGKLKATDAEIKGNLSLDSLSLTGEHGSYYYNEEAITLPEADEYKHTVIFIITANTATEVTAHNGDVLFVLSNGNISTITSDDSMTLDTYKIYLAISISNGEKGWLIQSLNSQQINNSHYNYYASTLSHSFGSWDTNDIGSDAQGSLIVLDKDQVLCEFYDPDAPSYGEGIINKKYVLSGTIYCQYNGDIAIIHLGNKEVDETLLNNLIQNSNSSISVNNLKSIYGISNNVPIGNTIYVDSPSNPTIYFTNSGLNIDWPNYTRVTDPDVSTTVHIFSYMSLIESFYWPSTNTNSPSPVTTTTVGSNGLVIDKGIIVAINMPVGAAVNSKDCIVYKDVTQDVNHEKYEVTNYGTSNITIGNTILNSGSSILIEAATNAHIDFSDVAAIDSSDIYDVDPAEQGDPVNH